MRTQVKEFVRQMVKGREMGVLRADGAVKPVLCGLTRTLDVFRIKAGEDIRKVKLAELMRVIHGSPDELSDLETPLDNSCSTLELESSECISFKFAERQAREAPAGGGSAPGACVCWASGQQSPGIGPRSRATVGISCRLVRERLGAGRRDCLHPHRFSRASRFSAPLRRAGFGPGESASPQNTRRRWR